MNLCTIRHGYILTTFDDGNSARGLVFTGIAITERKSNPAILNIRLSTFS